MLDFSWSHILIVLIVALVVVGPKDLPRLMRLIGQWTNKARAMAGQFRKTFDDMAREGELDELRKEIGNLRAERPLAGLDSDLHQSIVPDGMKSRPASPDASQAAAPQAAAPQAGAPQAGAPQAAAVRAEPAPP